MGYLKAKMVNFLLFFLFFFGGNIIINDLAQNTFLQNILYFFTELSDFQLTVMLVIPMLLFLMIFYFLSLTFYRNREF
ncbi:hypothetical protein J9303_15165 [Bacillaceae bacterium Marseille-Q3522]|nr:hypothetical protein [Bacillaceae bacterium Marseille-Q3522]